MSYADHIFINMCKDIIENGTSTERRKGTAEMGGWNQCLYDQTVWCGKSL